MMTSGKEEIPGFQRFDHKASVQVQSGEMAIDHPVFFAGKGPAILLMHELPGLAQPCVDFAMRLIAADFEVFMPQLIGPLLRYEPWRNVARLCISAEFARLRAGEAAPIADWLRDLARRISIERNQARIGAIGMCLTGAFVIPLLLEPEVQAVVASQPSVPFNLRYVLFGGPVGQGAWQYQINASDEQLEQAVRCARGGNKVILIQRFSADRLCPKARNERLATAFNQTALNYDTSPLREWSARPPHALLTEEFDRAKRNGPVPESDPTRIALQRVIDFFKHALKTS